MTAVNGNNFAQGTLWDNILAGALENIKSGKDVGQNLELARSISTYTGIDLNGTLAEAEKASPVLVQYNEQLGKIGLGELEHVEQARKLAKTVGLDEEKLEKTIQIGAREKFLTLSLYIGTGDLTYIPEARKLIETYGEDQRNVPGIGKEKRTELLQRSIESGEKAAAVKRGILLEDGKLWKGSYI